jgi:hypothetical protein
MVEIYLSFLRVHFAGAGPTPPETAADPWRSRALPTQHRRQSLFWDCMTHPHTKDVMAVTKRRFLEPARSAR